MNLVKVVSEYRWPIFLAGLLSMSVLACGILVWVATRPDSPRPIEGYYEAASAWDATEAEEEASRQLGWTVQFDLPADVPHLRGMMRPIDITVLDRTGAPVAGLTGRLLAVRPSDTRLNQQGTLTEMPTQAGRYRTLIRLDEPGAWDLRLDTTQQQLRFVHTARFLVAQDAPSTGGLE